MRARNPSQLCPGWLLAIAAFALAVAAPVMAVAQKSAQAPQQSARSAPVEDRAADIEERLIDLQVQIATARSLAAIEAPAETGVAPQYAFRRQNSAAGGDQQLAALENEVRTLSAEFKQLSGRPSPILPAATKAHAPVPAESSAQPPVASTSDTQGSAPGWLGSTIVTPNNLPPGTGPRGEILPGNVFPGTAPAPGNSVAGWAKPDLPAASAPAASLPVGNAETDYQTAYGYLLQQDYGAAQTAFVEFVSRHPNTPLAGNAQYWIGETHYVRGAYKDAAVAFLKGYEKYGDGNKGPDSLLKLALSLGKLRQNAAACSSLRELANRYRSAPQTLLARGQNEMRRLRCPAN